MYTKTGSAEITVLTQRSCFGCLFFSLHIEASHFPSETCGPACVPELLGHLTDGSLFMGGGRGGEMAGRSGAPRGTSWPQESEVVSPPGERGVEKC